MTPLGQTDRARIFRPFQIAASFLASLFLYTLTFPNLLFPRGLGVLGWLALSPLFAVLPDMKPKTLPAAGAVYGFVLYALSNYWLGDYHPVALLIACVYAAVCLLLLFPILGLVSRSFPKSGFAAFPLLWLSYEFLRSRGFMGYPYGVLGYAFWRNSAVLGLASLGGVWLVSLAALCVNTILGYAIRRLATVGTVSSRIRAAWVPTALALGIVALATVSGYFLKPSYEPRGYVHAALVQPNYRDRQRSLKDYQAMSSRLIRLTETAREHHPDLIVWHETAIVPPLAWHLRFRPNRETLDLALRMDGYIRSLDTPLLFGNGRAEPTGNDARTRKNWNSAFLFAGGEEVGSYDKMRLVPYSETFPFASALPGIKARIESEVGQFWESGRDLTVFRLRDARFSVPICFEDSFGDLTRAMAAAGAEFLVVLTDDSWGRAESCQYHHLTQSALRAAELGIPIARAANTGATVLLGPDGRVVSEMAPFTEGVLYVDIPLPPESYTGTPYRVIGDAFGWAALAASIVLVLAAASSAIRRRLRRHAEATAGRS